MQPLHLIIFTSIWTATWIAPWPKLSKGAELTFGLIPFGAFGLRVFASFFQGVPAADPVRQAVAPLLAWVAGDAGGLQGIGGYVFDAHGWPFADLGVTRAGRRRRVLIL